MKTAIQYIETAKTATDAIRISAILRHQDGFIGARILAPGKDSGFTVQAFFDDGMLGAPWLPAEWLPDGCRRVMIPESVLRRIA